MLQIILFSAASGIAGMGLGSFVSAVLLKKPSENMICWLLSFAAGVMVSIVCFGLVPEAYEIAGMAVSVSGLVLGIVIIMGLNYIVDRITGKKEGAYKVHQTHEELFHESQLINNPKRMLRSGTLMLIAIALHNIPEGMAIGAGGIHDVYLGALLALMIAVHNIPEGMAIAAPLLAGGVNRWKVVFLTSLAGATTLLGGVIGILIGSVSDAAIAFSLSAAGGAMLYIVFAEIMPQSIVMTKKRTASVVTLFGVIVGLLATQIL
ncbi:MAG: ZIP family metal transporter [Treponema sp.]|nr:ZIP family metal transporter [Treponema sp.]